VLPVGTRVSGQVERLEPASKTRRVMGAMTGDFSPHPRVVLAFDSITVGEGSPIGIEALATGGGHRVKRTVAEGTEPAPDPQSAIGRMRRTASEEAQSVVGVLKEPGKTERLQEAAINAL